jgi:hypothetical protein
MLKQISHRKIVKRRPLYYKGESFGCIGYFLDLRDLHIKEALPVVFMVSHGLENRIRITEM